MPTGQAFQAPTLSAMPTGQAFRAPTLSAMPTGQAFQAPSLEVCLPLHCQLVVRVESRSEVRNNSSMKSNFDYASVLGLLIDREHMRTLISL
jgi:hypothetical protein